MVHLLEQIIPWSLKAMGKMNLKVLSWNYFCIPGHRDLDLWPTNLKTGVLLLSSCNHPINLKGCGWNRTKLLSKHHFCITGHKDHDLWLNALNLPVVFIVKLYGLSNELKFFQTWFVTRTVCFDTCCFTLHILHKLQLKIYIFFFFFL